METSANSTTEVECPQCGVLVRMPGYADVAVCSSCGSTLAREQVRAAEDELETHVEKQVLHSVQCSQCAGPLSVSEGRRILECDHCGVRVVVLEHGGFSRWYFPPRVDRIHAATAGAGWLREYPGIAKRAREAHLVDAHLVYAPIWEHRALLAGWEFGQKLRTRFRASPPVADGYYERVVQGNLELLEEGVHEPRLQERRYYQAATDFEDLGATRPRVTGRELLVPLLAGELDASSTVLDARGSPSEVAERGRRAAVQPLSGAISPDTHLFTFRESVSLLYHPLWLVRYQDGGRPCRVVVNGRDGSVISGTAPADITVPIAFLTAETVFMAIVAALLVWLAIRWESGRSSILAAAVIVFLADIWSMWRFRKRFREGKEVEYHEPFSS
jgi:DNA-directed RNA polymerase subunit RPC12/RpoP